MFLQCLLLSPLSSSVPHAVTCCKSPSVCHFNCLCCISAYWFSVLCSLQNKSIHYDFFFFTKDSLINFLRPFTLFSLTFYLIICQIIPIFTIVSFLKRSPLINLSFSFHSSSPLLISSCLPIQKFLLFLCSHHLVSHICSVTHICQSLSAPTLVLLPKFPSLTQTLPAD